MFPSQVIDPKLFLATDQSRKPEFVKETDDFYHSVPGILSASSLKTFLRSPSRFYADAILGVKKEATDSMNLGTLVHQALLQPTEYLPRFTVKPDFGDGRTKEAKESFARWKADIRPDAIIIKEDDWLVVQAAIKSVQKNKEAAALLAEGVAEQSGYFTMGGFNCRIKPDFMPASGGIVDLKTSVNANQRVFTNQAWNLGYHIQAAFYMMGVEIITGKRPDSFKFIVVENEFPADVAVYTAGESFIYEGIAQVHKGITALKECIEKNDFPGLDYGDGMLNPPNYAELTY